MQMLKKGLKIILALMILLLIAMFLYLQNLKPTYKGDIKINTIHEPVDVYFDDIGVPHIYAKNQEDAYVALGYVHAQDRLWQMELIRRISAGRLSEILGKDFIKTDKFFLGLGIDDAAQKSIQNLDLTSNYSKLALAYLKGINQYINTGSTPIEFTLLGLKKENYTLKDMYNVMGYMSFSFASAHKTDPLLSNMKKKLDPKYLEELEIEIDPNSTLIPNNNSELKIESNFVSSVNTIMDNLPVPPFVGSNSWVLGPQKTETGKVIFANDPHIAFSQPSVWYQSHIVCPDFEIYGFNLALSPFSLLGHTRNHAYGLTMLKNDDIDFYEEVENPEHVNEYLTEDGYLAYKIIKKTIKIKNSPSETFFIKVGKHGPIMNDFVDLIESENPVAMDWIYTKFDNKMLEIFYTLSHATTIDEFKLGVSKIHAPGLNVMYGDSENNIAWFAAGKLYTRTNNANSKFILDGSNGEDDDLTYIDFKDNPKAINPSWGYVYSANNQPEKVLNNYYPGYYSTEDRAKRIDDVLSSDNNFSVDEMKELINDVISSVIPDLIPIIVDNIATNNLSVNEKAAIILLRGWDGGFEVDQVAPTIFTKFKYQFLKNTFEDELGEKGFQQFLGTGLLKRQFARQILFDDSVWNDDINTHDIKENKINVITKSFKETIYFLENQQGELINEWVWGNVHTIEHKHTFSKKLPSILKKHFNVGPYGINGSEGVLNNLFFKYTEDGTYEVTNGPSTRRVIDFSDIENSYAILPTGQSGNFLSKHYKDQTQKYIDGEFVLMLMNKDSIQKSIDKLLFIPKK